MTEPAATPSPSAPAPVTHSPPGAADAGSPPPAPSTVPGQTTPPAEPQVTAEELASLRHKANAYGEFEGVIGALRAEGITSVDHYRQRTAPLDLAKQRGVDVMQLINSVPTPGAAPAEPASNPGGEAKPLTMEDLQSFHDQRSAEAQEAASLQAERRAVEQVVTELGGSTPETQAAVTALVDAQLNQMPLVHPYGHPKAGQPRSATPQEVETAKVAAKAALDALTGAAIVAAAPAAPTPNTPAGTNGLTGQPPADPGKTAPATGLDPAEVLARSRNVGARMRGPGGMTPTSTATV